MLVFNNCLNWHVSQDNTHRGGGCRFLHQPSAPRMPLNLYPVSKKKRGWRALNPMSGVRFYVNISYSLKRKQGLGQGYRQGLGRDWTMWTFRAGPTLLLSIILLLWAPNIHFNGSLQIALLCRMVTRVVSVPRLFHSEQSVQKSPSMD